MKKGKRSLNHRSQELRRRRNHFTPKRYPSFFKLRRGEGERFLTIPEREEKTIPFGTDAEDTYFDRVDDPGDLKISILQFKQNETSGGTERGKVDDPGKLLDVRKSSPKNGISGSVSAQPRNWGGR